MECEFNYVGNREKIKEFISDFGDIRVGLGIRKCLIIGFNWVEFVF